MKKMLKIAISLAVIFGSFCVGLRMSIQGPTLLDLIDMLHVNQDTMSYALAYTSLAYSFGGFLSGFIFEYLNRQLLVATYFMVFGIANLIVPWLSDFVLFSVITFSKMMAAGGTDCGANVWILEMWPGQDAWLQALHFSFALGTALGPTMAEPFLSPDQPDDHVPNSTPQANFSIPESESRIHVPYSICGIAALVAAVALYSLHLYEPYVAPKRVIDFASTQQKAKGQQQLENYKIAQETGGKKASIERLALKKKDGLECCEVAIISTHNSITTDEITLTAINHNCDQAPVTLSSESQQSQSAALDTLTASNSINSQALNEEPSCEGLSSVAAMELDQTKPLLSSSLSPSTTTNNNSSNNTQQQTGSPVVTSPDSSLEPEMVVCVEVPPQQLQPKVTPATHISSNNSTEQQKPQQHDDEITLAIQISEPAPPPGVGSHMIASTALVGTKPVSPVSLANQAPVKVKVTSKAAETDGPPPYYVQAAIFMAACSLSFYCGIEMCSMNYMVSFAVNTNLQLTKSQGAHLSSALTACFAIGRAFGVWIAIFVKPHILFYCCISGVIVGNIGIYFSANTDVTILWVSVCVFGLGCGPMFPAIVSFYDKKIAKVTNTVGGIFILGSMFQNALSSLIVGGSIVDKPLILPIINLVCSLLLLVLFLSLHLLTEVKKSQRMRKYKARELEAAIKLEEAIKNNI